MTIHIPKKMSVLFKKNIKMFHKKSYDITFSSVFRSSQKVERQEYICGTTAFWTIYFVHVVILESYSMACSCIYKVLSFHYLLPRKEGCVYFVWLGFIHIVNFESKIILPANTFNRYSTEWARHIKYKSNKKYNVHTKNKT